MQSLGDRLLERSRVAENGCREWTGPVNDDGYGQFRVGSRTDGSRRTIRVHRAAYIAFIGSIPDGLHVLHTCDNPACIAPTHLFLGTHNDNMRDRAAKGRNPKPVGERNPAAKLSQQNVDDIRHAYASGQINQYELAAVYGVSQGTIGFIVRGERWQA